MAKTKREIVRSAIKKAAVGIVPAMYSNAGANLINRFNPQMKTDTNRAKELGEMTNTMKEGRKQSKINPRMEGEFDKNGAPKRFNRTVGEMSDPELFGDFGAKTGKKTSYHEREGEYDETRHVAGGEDFLKTRKKKREVVNKALGNLEQGRTATGY